MGYRMRGDDLPAAAYRGLDLTLRPRARIRATMAATIGSCPIVMGVTGIGSISAWWCAGLIALGVASMVRFARLGIRCHEGVLAVRGVLTTRHVPAGRVINVIMKENGSWVIVYRTRLGWWRRLRPSGFSSSELPSVRARDADALGRLRRWLAMNGAPWIDAPPLVVPPLVPPGRYAPGGPVGPLPEGAGGPA